MQLCEELPYQFVDTVNSTIANAAKEGLLMRQHSPQLFNTKDRRENLHDRQYLVLRTDNFTKKILQSLQVHSISEI